MSSDLYAFEEPEGLDFLPLAARRALDRSGLRLSLDGWRSLSLPVRRALVATGAGAEVDDVVVRTACSQAIPAPESCATLADPGLDEVPAPVALRACIATERWRELRPLDRYSVAKLTARDRAGRLGPLLDELRIPRAKAE